MPLITQRVMKGLLPFLNPHQTPRQRNRPEKIILGVKSGHRPSDKPPVRIFLGTERQQFRAERVFLWSVEKHRDPSRIYEIYLLKGLKGFNSSLWITGFTGYRFAIPYFCDYKGRALYNDVDQIWLTDPADVFDRNMGDAGFVSINDHDTSVMLVDCQRMADVWNRDAIAGKSRKIIESRARDAGLWGPLENRYNARDKEYEPGRSDCVHFTTLHTQPWRPFPDQYVYDNNPTGSLWPNLEEEANQVGFFGISAPRPSAAWPDFLRWLSSRPDGKTTANLLGPHADDVAPVEQLSVQHWLEHVPDADLPWVLDRLFSKAGRVDIRLKEVVWIRSGAARRSRHFWIEQLHLAAAMNPQTQWSFERSVGWSTETLSGGPEHPGPIVVLSGRSSRTRIKAEAVGNALARYTGRKMQRSTVRIGTIQSIIRLVLGLRIPSDASVRSAAIIVASGGLGTRIAKRIARFSERPPKLVLIGRRAGAVPEHGGVAVSMQHHQLPPHPNRIETLMGFGHQDYFRPTLHSAKWSDWLKSQQRVTLMLGHCARFDWDEDKLRQLIQSSVDWARNRNARLLVIANEKTGQWSHELTALCENQCDLYCWRADGAEISSNPFALALERSSSIIVAGDDAAFLSEALASPAPVYLWPEHQAFSGIQGALRQLRYALARRVADRANKPGFNNRGSVRPQQGLTYLCARLVERGWVLPPTTLIDWQRTIVDQGQAAWFGDDAIPSIQYQLETKILCQQIIDRLKLAQPIGAASQQSAPTGQP